MAEETKITSPIVLNETYETQTNATNTKLDTTNTNIASVGTKLDTTNTNIKGVGTSVDNVNTTLGTTNTNLGNVSDGIGDIGTKLDSTNEKLDSMNTSLADKLDQQNAYLAMLALANSSTLVTDYSSIQKIVQAGLADRVFTIGDQITVNWTDSVANKTYEWPFNIVSFEDVTLASGDVVPGLWLQAHYCSPFGVMFDQTEALYYCEEALPAGTYYFTIGTSWGTNCVSGSSYYFTTTVDIPAGGQIRIGVATENNAWAAPDTAVSNWRVWTYSSPSSTTSLEGVALELTEGTEGTELGTTTSSIKYDASNINNLQRAGYGYNRWSQSGIRQYLNSSAAIGGWWTPQNNFDRAPSQLGTYPGFMSGLESDFLSVVKPIKVTTALNTVSDSTIGTHEDTYDTFFLASLEQQYITPQLSGVEGSAWDYWKQVTGSSTTIAQYVTGAFPITYAVNATTSAQHVRLRSAYRGNAHHTWNVFSSGYVYNGNASSANRFSPVCVIC